MHKLWNEARLCFQHSCVPFGPLPYLTRPVACGSSTGLNDPTSPRLPPPFCPVRSRAQLRMLRIYLAPPKKYPQQLKRLSDGLWTNPTVSCHNFNSLNFKSPDNLWSEGVARLPASEDLCDLFDNSLLFISSTCFIISSYLLFLKL